MPKLFHCPCGKGFYFIAGDCKLSPCCEKPLIPADDSPMPPKQLKWLDMSKTSFDDVIKMLNEDHDQTQH